MRTQDNSFISKSQKFKTVAKEEGLPLRTFSFPTTFFRMGREKKKAKKRARSDPKIRKGHMKMVKVVPGYTRTAGAYARSLPCGPEKKFLDNVFQDRLVKGTAGTFTGASLAFSPGFLAIQRNTSDIGRIGNQVCVKNFNFRGTLQCTTVAGNPNPQRARIIFFWDLQANGAAANAGNMLEGPLLTTEVDTFRNLDEVARFKVIKDKTFIMNPKAMSGATPVNSCGQSFTVKVSWKGDMPVHYSADTGAIGEMRSENLSYFVWSDSIDDVWVLNGVGRVKFTDL